MHNFISCLLNWIADSKLLISFNSDLLIIQKMQAKSVCNTCYKFLYTRHKMHCWSRLWKLNEHTCLSLKISIPDNFILTGKRQFCITEKQLCCILFYFILLESTSECVCDPLYIQMLNYGELCHPDKLFSLQDIAQLLQTDTNLSIKAPTFQRKRENRGILKDNDVIPVVFCCHFVNDIHTR